MMSESMESEPYFLLLNLSVRKTRVSSVCPLFFLGAAVDL